MATETTVTLICDRCGSRHEKSSYMAGSSWGQMTLNWRGDKGGRAWDGTAAGVELKGTAWLCDHCTDAFLAFIKPKGGSHG